MSEPLKLVLGFLVASPDSVTALCCVSLKHRKIDVRSVPDYGQTPSVGAAGLEASAPQVRDCDDYRRAFLFFWMGKNVVLSGHLLFPVAPTADGKQARGILEQCAF
jgi:hypothetical protein